MITDIVKIFIPATLSFIAGIAVTPIISNFLYANQMWKKKAGKISLDGTEAKIFNELHKTRETGTPKMGGVVIWLSVIVVTIGLWMLAVVIPNEITLKLDFLSRNQTWIPLFTLIIGALVGLVDDYMDITSSRNGLSGGLSLAKRLLVVAIVAAFCALWFYFKLDVNSINIPLIGELYLGILFIPLFIMVTLALYSGGVIDGIDGLAGGIFAAIFSAYAGIAFFQNQINLAALCATIVGAILAFLWFNIPPARFYMSETGSMALTVTLAVVAFMTDNLGEGYGLIVLPIIALPLVLTTLSNIIQIASKKIRGKKVFHVAPLHHHFEALGWPAYKVTMRYWVISIVVAIVGLIVAMTI